MRPKNKLIIVLACVAVTVSCTTGKHDLFKPEAPDLIDPQLGLNRNDYKNINDLDSYKKEPGLDSMKASANVSEPPLPDLAEILAAPKPPKLGETKLVSIAVTDDVPLKDVLIELARLADVDIEVDASISGGIAFRAKDRPFNEVIERIADLAGLRYSMKNNVLRVERDSPYIQIYSLDFLNMDRTSQNNISVSTNVLSSSGNSSGGSGSGGTPNSGGGGSGGSGGGGGSSPGGGGSSPGGSSGGSSSSSGGGLNSGSSSNISTNANSDFWKQFEESIKQILTFRESKRVSNAVLAAQPPAAGGKPGADPAVAAAVAAAVNVPPPEPQVGAGGAATAVSGTFEILNREGSTLTVSATEKQHEMIKDFIKKIKANSTGQVLIEAKIVEVTLDDQYQSGIDWSKIGNNKVNFAAKFGSVTDVSNVAAFTLAANNDLNGAVKLAQIFGTTRTLSSPRLHAINNQQAVLTFADNQVYFTVSAVQTQNTTSGLGIPSANTTLTVTSSPHTVPIGIILALQPSINQESQEVTLDVRPTLSRVTGTVDDPAVAYTLALAKQSGVDITGLSAAVPIVQVRELDSILKLKSGQIMVIGGLMQDVSKNTDNGIPGASSLPWIGNLFKGTDKENTMEELVIFIRATIVDSSGDSTKADKAVYEKFTKDPRPLPF